MLRWKLDIQQFNFTIEHIKGMDNVVADDFSRQCDRVTLEEEEEVAAMLSTQCNKLDIEYCATLDPDECYESSYRAMMIPMLKQWKELDTPTI
jgi:hypothetical protein